MPVSNELLDRLRADISEIEGRSVGGNTASPPTKSKQKGYRTTDCLAVPNSDENDVQAALKKIVQLINVRERSTSQIRERLLKLEFTEDVTDKAVRKATSLNLIDDKRYADLLIRSRINQGKGAEGIERELRSEGIDINEVSGWPYSYPVSYDEEYSRAINLLERKPSHAKNRKQASYRKLIQNGYSSRVASDAVNSMIDDR